MANSSAFIRNKIIKLDIFQPLKQTIYTGTETVLDNTAGTPRGLVTKVTLVLGSGHRGGWLVLGQRSNRPAINHAEGDVIKEITFNSSFGDQQVMAEEKETSLQWKTTIIVSALLQVS